jgi:hypothetical protein
MRWPRRIAVEWDRRNGWFWGRRYSRQWTAFSLGMLDVYLWWGE